MKRFQRDKDHRRALFVNLTKNLIKHKAIVTTITKAKDLRIFVEKILTRSKENTLHNKKIIAGILMNDWDMVNILFNEIGPKIQGRPGGYSRILKLGIRNDGAVKCLIELVDFSKTTDKPKTNVNIESEKIIKPTAEDITIE
jgi:large subunit ribosomal protein L17